MCNCDTGFSTFIVTLISVIIAAPIGAWAGVTIVKFWDKDE